MAADTKKTRRIGTSRSARSGSAGCRCRSRAGPTRRRSIATIHAALDAGVTLIDTADAYHLDARRGRPQRVADRQGPGVVRRRHVDVLVATKGGHLRPGDGSWTLDGSPEHLRAACEASLSRLGVEAIGLYQFHRPDPKVPYAESVGAHPRPARRGQDPAWPASPTPTRTRSGWRTRSSAAGWSPCRTSSPPPSAPASRELDLCDELGHRVPALEPARRHRAARPTSGSASAAVQPRRRGPRTSARSRCALAWMLAKSPYVIPIPGSSRPETIRDSYAAADLVLTPDQVATLDAA